MGCRSCSEAQVKRTLTVFYNLDFSEQNKSFEEDNMNNANSTLDLKSITTLERELIEIALGVLRSKSDYADFLNCWLHDYGRRVLSPNPPLPLLANVEHLDMSEDDCESLAGLGSTSVTVH